MMDKNAILARLKLSEAALRKQGVHHAALFGSMARGDQHVDSDIDIMLEFDPTYPLTLFDYVGVKDYVYSLFDRPVDVVNKAGLKPAVAASALAAAIYAF